MTCDFSSSNSAEVIVFVRRLISVIHVVAAGTVSLFSRSDTSLFP